MIRSVRGNESFLPGQDELQREWVKKQGSRSSPKAKQVLRCALRIPSIQNSELK